MEDVLASRMLLLTDGALAALLLALFPPLLLPLATMADAASSSPPFSADAAASWALSCCFFGIVRTVNAIWDSVQ